MNVYHKEFHPEFIKELPVNFNKIKNMNLSEIPECYHELFTTDWNWGKYSSMKMDKRMDLQQLFLEYQHYSMLAMIEDKSPSTKYENKPVGFVKD